MNPLLMRSKLTILLLVISLVGHAQDMEEVMQSNDKINVVFAVILIILIGFVSYLFYLDSKVNKLEKRQRSNEKES